MKLVKREPDPHEHASEQFKSICYLHNCAKFHDGKPCPMTVVAKPGEQVTCPICGTHIAEAAETPTARKILYWTDPMIPGYKADGPGKSPMGMDVVPVYAEEAGPATGEAVSLEGYAPVLLTPQKQQLIGVRTALAQKRTLTKTIRTAGRIAYDPELYQTEAEYLQSLKTLAHVRAGGSAEGATEAQRLVDSSRMKLRLMGLSQELIDEMANWDGPDKSLLLSDAGGKVWLYAPVYEFELPFVAVGQTVSVEVPSATGQRFEGVIRSVDSVLDPATRSARARAVLTDPNGVLKPEMFVNASIAVSVGEVLAIPEEAVFHTGTKDIVFVDKGQGVFEPRQVTLGIAADGFDEVKDGIAEGEAVVASGNFLIDSESRLKAALQGAAGAPEHQHGQ
jgi:Cu(I)/Ag(I) efflux system membrane fusion protein/cobalt-zinc-cadmium efflux system membrane fusion protein